MVKQQISYILQIGKLIQGKPHILFALFSLSSSILIPSYFAGIEY